MEKIDVRREAERLGNELDTFIIDSGHHLSAEGDDHIEERLRSLLARDRREMAEEIGERFPELPGGSQLGDVKSWLLSKAEEMEMSK